MTETVPSPYGPTWYAATMVAAPERPPLRHNLDVDACVIGAGLAGLTVAREVARRGWSVAVLEAQQVAAGASGRNAGFVSPGFSERIDAIVDRVGLPRAKELWALSESGAEYVRRTITDAALPDVQLRDGRLAVRRIDDEAALIEHAAMLRVDFGADVEAWPADQVREVLRKTETELKGETMTGAVAVVSPEFFDKLIGHAKVEDAYKFYASTSEPLRNDVRRRFPFAGLVFEEYNATVTLSTGNTETLVPAGEGIAFPLGTLDTFVTYGAPANLIETVNTVGLPIYARQLARQDGSAIEVKTEASILPINKRPRLAVRIFSSN